MPANCSRPVVRTPARQRGITLLELMVTMVIASVVLTLGVSSMSSMIEGNNRAAEVNTMIGHMNFARTEAIYRAESVVVCPVDPSDMAAGCTTGTTSWGNGYGVVVVNDPDESSDDVLLLFENPGARLKLKSTVTQFAFAANGSSTMGNIVFCDANYDLGSDGTPLGDYTDPRAVVVSAVGRVRVSEKTGSNTAINCNF